MNFEYRDIISSDGTVLKMILRETGASQWLIVTHGLGEHAERHTHMFKLFSADYNIAIYDLRGHGKSAGKRAWVNHFGDYLSDLDNVIHYLKKEFNLSKYVLFGHSMGGLITAAYLQNRAQTDLYPQSVYLSSPAVSAPGLMGVGFSYAPMVLFQGLSHLPTLPLQGILDLKKLSHDNRVYEDYIHDPLNLLKIHSKLFFEILKTARDVFSRPLRARCPLFVSVGSADALVNPDLIKKYFTYIEKNSHLKVFEGGYHELHNEIEKFRTPYFNFLRQSLTGQTFE